MRLRTKLKIEGNDEIEESPEELKLVVEDMEFNIEKKLLQLTQGMRETAFEIRGKRDLLKRSDS